MSGNPKSLAIAPDCTRIFGTISTPGQYGNNKEVAVVMDKIVLKEINLHGCHAQSYHSNDVAIKIVESRKYPLEKLVTHKFKLEDAEKAVLTAGRKIPGEDPIKVVITPQLA
jgi:threonine dehydrogenase-like Zn-dependent dehydrogenase